MKNANAPRNSSIEGVCKELGSPKSAKHPYFRESLESLVLEQARIREKLKFAIEESYKLSEFREVLGSEDIFDKKIENLKEQIKILDEQISLYQA